MVALAVKFVRDACPLDCPDACATVVEVRDGRAVDFAGDKEHPVTRGWLCAKVRPYLERVYHPDRLRYPLARVGPKGAGDWRRIDWDEAVARIAGRWQEIIAEHGPAAILPYSYSGTLGLLQLAVCNTRLWNRMGASGLQRSICGAAAEAAVVATLGARRAPDLADLPHSRLILLWGHNPASTSPHAMPFLREAQRNGAHIVVIDPRRTLSARGADEHISPRPATDGALALGLMHVLFAEGLHDERWLSANTAGWEELRARGAVSARQGCGDHRRASRDDHGAGAALWDDQARAAQVRRRGAAPRQRRPDRSPALLPARHRGSDRRARRRPFLQHE